MVQNEYFQEFIESILQYLKEEILFYHMLQSLIDPFIKRKSFFTKFRIMHEVV